MEVLVEVETENLATEERHKALTASFIYVSMDRTGKPRKVPPLLITTEEGEDSSRKDGNDTKPGRNRNQRNRYQDINNERALGTFSP